jgi:hypothetical protein
MALYWDIGDSNRILFINFIKISTFKPPISHLKKQIKMAAALEKNVFLQNKLRID